MWVSIVIDAFFGISLFVNASLFIPQAARLIKKKDSQDLSLITFVGFCITQIAAIAYGYLHHDYILMIGYALSLLTCGVVTVLIVHYRKK